MCICIFLCTDTEFCACVRVCVCVCVSFFFIIVLWTFVWNKLHDDDDDKSRPIPVSFHSNGELGRGRPTEHSLELMLFCILILDTRMQISPKIYSIFHVAAQPCWNLVTISNILRILRFPKNA